MSTHTEPSGTNTEYINDTCLYVPEDPSVKDASRAGLEEFAIAGEYGNSDQAMSTGHFCRIERSDALDTLQLSIHAASLLWCQRIAERQYLRGRQ